MLTIGFKKPYLQYNKELLEYCKKSTEDSIKRICEKHDLEKNKIKNINLNYIDNDDKKPNNNNFYIFLSILSITSIGFIFYKRLK